MDGIHPEHPEHTEQHAEHEAKDSAYLCACCSAADIADKIGSHKYLGIERYTVRATRRALLSRYIKESWEDSDPYFVDVVKFFLVCINKEKLVESPITPEENVREAAILAEEASALLTSISSIRNQLESILDSYGSIIYRRWMKKSRADRERLLKMVRPGIPLKHRPDHDAFRQLRDGSLQFPFKDLSVFYVPNINVDDLCKDIVLLEFLQTRARNATHHFTFVDLEAARFGFALGCISHPDRITGYSFTRSTFDAESYDTIVRREKDHIPAYPGEDIDAAQGISQLKIQLETMEFLQKFTENILHDIPINLLAIKSPAPSPEPSLVMDLSKETLRSVAGRSAYQMPVKLDFRRYLSLLTAKREASEHHVVCLKNDPEYFWSTLGEMSEHDDVRIPDQIMSGDVDFNSVEFWDDQIANVVTNAYGNVRDTGSLQDQLKILCSLLEKYDNLFQPTTSLPLEVKDALMKYGLLLNMQCDYYVKSFISAVQSSPEFRSKYRLVWDLNDYDIRPTRKQDHRDVLQTLLRELADDKWVDLSSQREVVEAIESCLQEGGEARRFSRLVMERFSHMALLTYLNHDLKRFEPWISSLVTKEDGERLAEIQSWWHLQCGHSNEGCEGLHEMKVTGIQMPSAKLFRCPPHTETEKTTLQAINAEKHLDEMWQVIDSEVEKLVGLPTSKLFDQYFLSPLEITRTKAWSSDRIPPPLGLLSLPQAPTFTELFPSWAEVLASKPIQPPKKIKIKTRKQTDGSMDFDYDPDYLGSDDDGYGHIGRRIKVGARAMKVFTAMFPAPGQDKQPGEINWEEFKYAMTEVGFQSQCLAGSAYTFEPVAIKLKSSICVHRPHPGNKVRLRKVRDWGHRLAVMHGWSSETFVLKE